MREVKIETPFIKLDQLLKFSGIVDIGSQAKDLILNGEVLVNGEVVKERGKKIKVQDVVETKKQRIIVT